MDLIERIDEIQVLLEEAKGIPFSSSALVDRDELLELIAQLKQELPAEVGQARWMARDRDDLLERARNEAERIVTEAREQRDRLLSRSEIVQASEHEAERILDHARERASRLRTEAEDYIDQKLEAFETLLTRMMATVASGRTQLRGDDPRAADPDAGPPGEIGPAELSHGAV